MEENVFPCFFIHTGKPTLLKLGGPNKIPPIHEGSRALYILKVSLTTLLPDFNLLTDCESANNGLG